MNETFKIIKEYPDYLVSNFGRVKTISRKLRYTHAITGKEHFRISQERFLKVQSNNLTGYNFHQLYKNKKMYNCNIHRLVALSFIENPYNYPMVNHIDGNKHNNTMSNLEWCDSKYNHEHATRTGLKAKGSQISSSKLNEQMVYDIRFLLKKGVSKLELSKAFNVSKATICFIDKAKTWKHVTLNKPFIQL